MDDIFDLEFVYLKQMFLGTFWKYYGNNRSVGIRNAGSIPATPSYGGRHG